VHDIFAVLWVIALSVIADGDKDEGSDNITCIDGSCNSAGENKNPIT